MNATTTPEQKTTTHLFKVLYTAKAHTTGGREGGASRTADGRLDVTLSVPGTPANGTNPEKWMSRSRSSKPVSLHSKGQP